MEAAQVLMLFPASLGLLLGRVGRCLVKSLDGTLVPIDNLPTL